MSVRITLVDATGPDWLGELDTLDEAVDDVHEYWMEEAEGGQAFVLQDANGFVLATMMRSQDDPEVCISAYAEGPGRGPPLPLRPRPRWEVRPHRNHLLVTQGGRRIGRSLTREPGTARI